MKLLPYDRFVLISNKSPKEVEKALRYEVEEPTWGSFLLGGSSRPYLGRFNEQGFKITPTIFYRSSFFPTIIGKVRPHPNGTRIVVTQRLHAFVAAFVFLWVSFVSLTSIPIMESNNFQISKILPSFLMVTFMWGLSAGGFWFMARDTKPAFKVIFDATEENR